MSSSTNPDGAWEAASALLSRVLLYEELRLHLSRLVALLGERPVTATEETLSRLEVRSYNKSTFASDATCCICLVDLEEGDPYYVLPCEHRDFHMSCVKKWLTEHSNKCPICRSPVKNESKSGDEPDDGTSDPQTSSMIEMRARIALDPAAILGGRSASGSTVPVALTFQAGGRTVMIFPLDTGSDSLGETNIARIASPRLEAHPPGMIPSPPTRTEGPSSGALPPPLQLLSLPSGTSPSRSSPSRASHGSSGLSLLRSLQELSSLRRLEEALQTATSGSDSNPSLRVLATSDSPTQPSRLDTSRYDGSSNRIERAAGPNIGDVIRDASADLLGSPRVSRRVIRSTTAPVLSDLEADVGSSRGRHQGMSLELSHTGPVRSTASSPRTPTTVRTSIPSPRTPSASSHLSPTAPSVGRVPLSVRRTSADSGNEASPAVRRSSIRFDGPQSARVAAASSPQALQVTPGLVPRRLSSSASQPSPSSTTIQLPLATPASSHTPLSSAGSRARRQENSITVHQQRITAGRVSAGGQQRIVQRTTGSHQRASGARRPREPSTEHDSRRSGLLRQIRRPVISAWKRTCHVFQRSSSRQRRESSSAPLSPTRRGSGPRVL